MSNHFSEAPLRIKARVCWHLPWKDQVFDSTVIIKSFFPLREDRRDRMLPRGIVPQETFFQDMLREMIGIVEHWSISGF